MIAAKVSVATKTIFTQNIAGMPAKASSYLIAQQRKAGQQHQDEAGHRHARQRRTGAADDVALFLRQAECVAHHYRAANAAARAQHQADEVEDQEDVQCDEHAAGVPAAGLIRSASGSGSGRSIRRH